MVHVKNGKLISTRMLFYINITSKASYGTIQPHNILLKRNLFGITAEVALRYISSIKSVQLLTAQSVQLFTGPLSTELVSSFLAILFPCSPLGEKLRETSGL